MNTINAIGAYMNKFIFFVISVLVYTAYKNRLPTIAVKIENAIYTIPGVTKEHR